MTLGGRQVGPPRLRVGDGDSEVPLASFQWGAATDALEAHALGAIAAGVSTLSTVIRIPPTCGHRKFPHRLVEDGDETSAGRRCGSGGSCGPCGVSTRYARPPLARRSFWGATVSVAPGQQICSLLPRRVGPVPAVDIFTPEARNTGRSEAANASAFGWRALELGAPRTTRVLETPTPALQPQPTHMIR